MQIRQAAHLTGLTPEAIRYFEREGLLSPPNRQDNGYRRYAASHLQRLHLIANCRALEMSHDEIRELIALLDQPADDCSAATDLIRHHTQHVRQRIRTLQGLLAQLKALDAQCARTGRVDVCDLVQALAQPAPGRARARPSHL